MTSVQAVQSDPNQYSQYQEADLKSIQEDRTTKYSDKEKKLVFITNVPLGYTKADRHTEGCFFVF